MSHAFGATLRQMIVIHPYALREKHFLSRIRSRGIVLLIMMMMMQRSSAKPHAPMRVSTPVGHIPPFSFLCSHFGVFRAFSKPALNIRSPSTDAA